MKSIFAVVTLSLLAVPVFAQPTAISDDPITAHHDAPELVQAPNNARQLTVFSTAVEVQSQGDVRYVTGGIGEDERAELQAMRDQFNLQVMSANKTGEFVEYALVTITNAAGEAVLQTEAGPLLYVALPTGRYTLTATLNDQQFTQKLTIGKKIAYVHLGWK